MRASIDNKVKQVKDEQDQSLNKKLFEVENRNIETMQRALEAQYVKYDGQMRLGYQRDKRLFTAKQRRKNLQNKIENDLYILQSNLYVKHQKAY